MILSIREKRLSNIQILYIIYLIPLLAGYRKGLEFRIVKHTDYSKNLLIVFVISQRRAIRIKERKILVDHKLPAELIDVHSLVILIHIRILECALRNEIDDIAILINPDHGSVHPGLILGYKRKVRIRIIQNQREHPVVKDEVRLQKNRIILYKLLTCKCQRIYIVGPVIYRVVDKDYFELIRESVADIIDQLLAFISDNDHDSVKVKI